MKGNKEKLENISDTLLFLDIMQGVAARLGFNLDFLDDGRKVVFSNGEEVYELLNYDIGLNTHQASMKAKDKSMCYEYLSKAGVPAIEHFLIKNPFSFNKSDVEVTLGEVKRKYGLPLVVKQNDGGGGKNVFFVYNDEDLISTVAGLFKRNLDVALSPFYELGIEYRCTVLYDEVLMWYGKEKSENQLKHNLSMGSRVVDVPKHLQEDLYIIAVKAVKALGLRFANVDIVETSEGLKVLEVNNTVTLKRVARCSDERKQEAIDVYVKAIEKLRNRKSVEGGV